MNPVSNGILTSSFGNRINPVSNKYALHDGIDISVTENSEVFNMIDGTVLTTGYSDTYGNYVHIKIDKDIYISYNHLNKVMVKDGDYVKSGDVIAFSGNTGSSTGPHLHLSIFVNDTPKDILPLVKYKYTQNFIDEYTARGELFVYED